MVRGFGARRSQLRGGEVEGLLPAMEKSSGGGGCAKTVKPILLATLALAGAVVMTGTAVQHATVPMNLVSANVDAAKSSKLLSRRRRITSTRQIVNASACFPFDATIELQGGEVVPMHQLKLGDSVRVGPKDFEPVFFFSHSDRLAVTYFVHVGIDGGRLLRLTADHLLFTASEIATKDGAVEWQPKTAGSVRVGDYVQLADGRSAKVASVERASGQGLYAPHTFSGKLVVDGVLVSCYTTALSPTISHVLLSPLRLVQEQWPGSASAYALQLVYGYAVH